MLNWLSGVNGFSLLVLFSLFGLLDNLSGLIILPVLEGDLLLKGVLLIMLNEECLAGQTVWRGILLRSKFCCLVCLSVLPNLFVLISLFVLDEGCFAEHAVLRSVLSVDAVVLVGVFCCWKCFADQAIWIFARHARWGFARHA